MEIEKVEQIIKLLKQYDLYNICIESDNFKLEIKDHKNAIDNVKSVECCNEKYLNSKSQKINDNEEYIIKSPLVGIVNILENRITCKKYSVGDKIESGQSICIIEAMKMLNEVTCNQDGIIAEILFKNNEFVEYEQPLFKIRKKGWKNV